QWAQSNPQPGGNFLDNGLEFYPRAVYEALHMVRDDYGWTGAVYITQAGRGRCTSPRTAAPTGRRPRPARSTTTSGSRTSAGSWSGSRSPHGRGSTSAASTCGP